MSRATLLEAVGGRSVAATCERGEGELGQVGGASPPEAHWLAGAPGPDPARLFCLEPTPKSVRPLWS